MLKRIPFTTVAVVLGATAVAAILLLQVLRTGGLPDPTGHGDFGARVLDIAVLVFREGLEAVLIFAVRVALARRLLAEHAGRAVAVVARGTIRGDMARDVLAQRVRRVRGLGAIDLRHTLVLRAITAGAVCVGLARSVVFGLHGSERRTGSEAESEENEELRNSHS